MNALQDLGVIINTIKYYMYYMITKIEHGCFTRMGRRSLEFVKNMHLPKHHWTFCGLNPTPHCVATEILSFLGQIGQFICYVTMFFAGNFGTGSIPVFARYPLVN